MTKSLARPDTRLICLGGARALTNSPIGEKLPEEVPVERFDP